MLHGTWVAANDFRCEEGLDSGRRHPRRGVAAAHRMERPEISRINAYRSMAIVVDSLLDGHRIRALTVVDDE
jgi:putative transposase